MAAAVLTIDINARLAKLEEGLNQANRRLGSFRSTVDSIGNSLKNALGGVAIGATVTKFVSLTKAAIDSADHLNDLSQSTGVAAVTLGGIGFAAEQAGSSLEGITPSLGKLNIEIAKAAQGNPQAAASFQALGISVKDSVGQTKDAGQVLVEIAAKFETYRDGPEKAALANELFKRGYQGLIPLLNEGSEKLRQNISYYERYSGLTKEATKQADQFNDELTKVNLLFGAFFRHLAVELLPAMQGLVGRMEEGARSAEGFKNQASDVATVIKAIAVAAIYGASSVTGLGRSLGVAAAQASLLASLDFKGVRALGEEFLREQEERRKNLAATIAAIQNPQQFVGPPRPTPNLPGAPGLPNAEGTKSALDAQLRAFEDAIREEQKTLADRERFLQQYYQDDEISIRDFFDSRQRVIDIALEKELAAYDGQLVALRDFARKASGTDRIKAEEDIAAVIRKRADVQAQAAARSVGLFFEERRALKGFRDDIEQTAIRLQELSGDRVGAALAQFDFANKERTVRINLELNSPDEEIRRLANIAREGIEQEREQIKVRAELNTVTERFGDILDVVGAAQARIDIRRQSGSLTELEALRATGEANRALIPLLQQQVDLYQEIADKSSDPRAQIAADQLRLKIEQLAASTDLVAKKFQDVFVDSFSSALEKVTQKGAKLKDILKALEQDIVQGISRIASRNIAEAVFSSDGPLGGIGKIFGDIFAPAKGKGGEAASSVLTGAGSTLLSAGSVLNAAGAQLIAAATALAASSAASGFASAFIPGGFSSPGIASDVFSFFGFAGGTDFAPGGLAMVGERGKELVRLPRGSQVIPNDRTERILSGRGGSNVTINAPITIQGTATTKTMNQAALQIAREVRYATARNG